MPSPFHQKYATQGHKVFGDSTNPAMPEGPKHEADRRASDSSIGSSPAVPAERRRSSAANRFAALEALKRPTDEQSTNRRASLQDSYAKPGMLGSMWNNFTRGSVPKPQQTSQNSQDISTLKQSDFMWRD